MKKTEIIKKAFIKQYLDLLNSGELKVETKHFTCFCPDEYTLDFSKNGFQAIEFIKVDGVWINV